jgi:ADP-ribose pyrophosphatase
MAEPDDGSIGFGAQLAETRVSGEAVFEGKFLQARRDQVRLRDGSPGLREYVVHPGAVMVIALQDDGQVVLERQYRYPVQRVMIEFPAGKLDPGETSLACAQRELQEETGYRAARWALAGTLHPAIAYSTEFIDIWFAAGLVTGAQSLDHGEFLEVFSATPAQLLSWCGSGQVSDAKTLAGALWLQNVNSGAWMLDWNAAHVDLPRNGIIAP